MQWAVEQEEAGGEVNFKEGLAFYSSIGILQVRERGKIFTAKVDAVSSCIAGQPTSSHPHLRHGFAASNIMTRRGRTSCNLWPQA